VRLMLLCDRIGSAEVEDSIIIFHTASRAVVLTLKFFVSCKDFRLPKL
jgi:hypothetical protein